MCDVSFFMQKCIVIYSILSSHPCGGHIWQIFSATFLQLSFIGFNQGQHLHRNLSWRLEMFQFNRSQQNHFCTSMLQLFLMKVGRNASTCCQHPQFLIESVDHRLVTISRFMLTLILQTASNVRLAAFPW